ncbi:MAG: hypothetical protein FWD14_05705 [Treponema sp.]|nr:hypothetical protein [Treponema sp.]
MKKIFVLFVVVLIVMFALSCASVPSASPAPAANLQIVPSWFNEMPQPDEIWGVGDANLQNSSLARQTATTSVL